MKPLALMAALGAALVAAIPSPAPLPTSVPSTPPVGPVAKPPPKPPAALPADVRVGARPRRIASYTIEARLDAKKHEVRGALTLTWWNVSAKPAPELLFHLYQNAFKNETTLFLDTARRHRFHQLHRKGSWGGNEVSEVKVDGKPVKSVKLEADGTVLRVTPAAAIPGVSRAVITLRFITRLSRIRARSGFEGDFHMVAQWFPKIGVRDADGTWHCHPFYMTSEFFADFGVYRVTVEVPKRFGVVASGRRTAEKAGRKGTRRVTYLAEDVHDFAWATGPRMKRLSRKVGTVTVGVAHFGDPPDQVRRHLDVMVSSLTLLQEWLGPYPYSRLHCVLVPKDADMAGGMEYPTLFTSSAEHPPLLERMGSLSTTVHELVHQYFYGLLASNEYAEPWLDEGFTQYMTGVLLGRIYGADRSAAEVGPFRLGHFALSRIWLGRSPGWDPPGRRSSDFAEPMSYFVNVYGKTSLVLRTLERQIGWKRMQGLLQDYFRSQRFQHPRGEDFFRVLERHVPEEPLRRFARDGIHTSGVLDYRVAKVYALKLRAPRGRFDNALDRSRRDKAKALAKKGYESRVLLQRVGELRIPVTIELRFRGGKRERHRWDGQQRWHWLVVHHKRPIESAVLDPDRTLALERRLLDNGLRVTADARPARRVTGRVLGLLQALLQTVGF
ncbi:MAG: M1 family metallopeptidase [bacterium]